MVFAVEPHPVIYSVLEENAKQVRNMFTLCVALGDQTYKSHLPIITDSTVDIPLVESGICVRVRPLDSITDKKITLMKINCSGNEYQVLLGANNIISTYRPVIVITIYNYKNDILDYFKTLRYEMINIVDNEYLVYPKEKYGMIKNKMADAMSE